MPTFLALSTGQNVANLVLILERIDVARDRVLWLETARARAKGWSSGALEVLRRRGLPASAIRELSCDGDGPEQLRTALRGALAGISRDAPLYWIANGGTKLQALALAQAVADWGGPCTVLYGDDRGVFYHEAALALDESPRSRRYLRTPPLDIHELLAVTGHVVLDDGQQPPRPIDLEAPPEPPEDGYGYDPERTHAVWLEHYRWQRAVRADATGNGKDEPYPTAERIRAELPDRFRDWIARLRREWQPLGSRLAKGADRPSDEQFQSAINQVRRLLQQAAGELRLRQAGAPPRPSSGGGAVFEQAVAARLTRWLAGDGGAPYRPLIAGIWRNLRIAEQARPETVRLELDLAVLLRSGVLLNIECKAGEFTAKDLAARFRATQRSTSLRARSAVCVPMYTEIGVPEAVADMTRQWTDIEQIPDYHPLPFTLPGQRPRIEIAAGGSPIRRELPDFESALADWLRGFLPPD